MTDDPVVRRLLRHAAGLRVGGGPSDHDVLATYVTEDQREEFAFCRRGLLIDPCGQSRFVPFDEIDEAKLLTLEELRMAKRNDVPAAGRRLTLYLRSGEALDLRIDGRDEDGGSDIIEISGLIPQRIVQDRWQPS